MVGRPTEANLAYSCSLCNRQKGSDLGSLAWQTGELIRFYNPRIDRWEDHFVLNGAYIAPVTEIGEVTARILEFNSNHRLQERIELISLNLYP